MPSASAVAVPGLTVVGKGSLFSRGLQARVGGRKHPLVWFPDVRGCARAVRGGEAARVGLKR